MHTHTHTHVIYLFDDIFSTVPYLILNLANFHLIRLFHLVSLCQLGIELCQLSTDTLTVIFSLSSPL